MQRSMETTTNKSVVFCLKDRSSLDFPKSNACIKREPRVVVATDVGMQISRSLAFDPLRIPTGTRRIYIDKMKSFYNN